MHKYQGASLIEILVSLFLLSIMLFGLDALGLVVLHETKNAYYLAVAEQQMFNMIEQIHAAKNIDISSALIQWNKQNKQLLPQGIGEIKGPYLSIYWGSFPDYSCSKNKIGESGCLQADIKL